MFVENQGFGKYWSSPANWGNRKIVEGKIIHKIIKSLNQLDEMRIDERKIYNKFVYKTKKNNNST